MADLVFNISKGKVAYYASLPAANDALVVVPILTAGIEADATLKDYDTIAALLAGASDEATTLGRKTLAGVAITVDDVNDRVDIDATDPVWTATAGGAISALVICYEPDTTAAADANKIPLVKLDCAMTPDGTDFTAQLNASGWFRAS